MSRPNIRFAAPDLAAPHCQTLGDAFGQVRRWGDRARTAVSAHDATGDDRPTGVAADEDDPLVGVVLRRDLEENELLRYGEGDDRSVLVLELQARDRRADDAVQRHERLAVPRLVLEAGMDHQLVGDDALPLIL